MQMSLVALFGLVAVAADASPRVARVGAEPSPAVQRPENAPLRTVRTRPPRPRFAQRRLTPNPGEGTPLVISFHPSGAVELTPAREGFQFEPGTDVSAAWPAPGNPWLVRDLDGNGLIDSGRELFGSFTIVDSRRAANGFQALAALDDNKDGVLDATDAAYESLRLWSDDGDRLTAAGELRSLRSAGISALVLTHETIRRCDRLGNCERERSALKFRDASGNLAAGWLVDVHLRMAPATTRSAASF